MDPGLILYAQLRVIQIIMKHAIHVVMSTANFLMKLMIKMNLIGFKMIPI